MGRAFVVSRRVIRVSVDVHVPKNIYGGYCCRQSFRNNHRIRWNFPQENFAVVVGMHQGSGLS